MSGLEILLVAEFSELAHETIVPGCIDRSVVFHGDSMIIRDMEISRVMSINTVIRQRRCVEW